MQNLIEEVNGNFSKFCDTSNIDERKVRKKLGEEISSYETSYRRLTSIQAWRVECLEKNIDIEVLGLFLEAQNDTLTSHVSARSGQWRLALKSLRSAIEEILSCLYYMDHPVEFQLWNLGKHKIGFSELVSYFERHPMIVSLPNKSDGLAILVKEYATLSKAVHGSSRNFWMSGKDRPLIWNSNTPSLSQWCTREKAVISGINFLLIALFREHLKGGQNVNLRKSISLVFSNAKQGEIKKQFSVQLYKT